MQTVVVLDNIRSVHNVGSIFRTSDALGVSKIYLCGVTPTPTDRFGRVRNDLAKVALGAEKNVPSEYFVSTEDCLRSLKQQGFFLVAVEQSEKSTDYKSFKITKNTALVLGEETKGLTQNTLSLCDSVVEIPMKGSKESLNVSVAFGIVVSRIID